MLFSVAIALAIFASIAAALLAFRLRKFNPAVHHSVDSPIGTEWWPFWVFHFISPGKWRRLSAGLKVLAFVAMLGLALSVVLLALLALRFAAIGGNL